MTLMMTIWNHPPLPNQFISSLLSLLDYFRCHTYDFGATGPGICRLSHHSSATLRHVEDPYLVARGAHSYEMGACFNVTIECQANYMVANVAANRMFDGKVRGRGCRAALILSTHQLTIGRKRKSLFESSSKHSSTTLCSIIADFHLSLKSSFHHYTALKVPLYSWPVSWDPTRRISTSPGTTLRAV